jgi:hypothetical protein
MQQVPQQACLFPFLLFSVQKMSSLSTIAIGKMASKSSHINILDGRRLAPLINHTHIDSRNLPVQVPELYILTREELEIHFCG